MWRRFIRRRCGDVCILDVETSALDVETSAFGAATSAIARRSFDATISALDAETSVLGAETSALGAARRRRRSRGVTGDIGAEFTAISAIAELVQLRRCVTELLIMEI